MRFAPFRMLDRLAIALCVVAGLSVLPASAQMAPVNASQSWGPVGHATLAVTAVTARVALPTIGPVARICNTGTKDAFLAFGTDNTVVATTAGWYVASAKCEAFSIKPFSTQYTYVAAIAGGADTTSLIIETGIGTP